MQFGIALQVDGVLAVSEYETFSDALVAEREQVAHGKQPHMPLDLVAAGEPQRHTDDDAEQSIAADSQREEFGVLGPAAGQDVASGVDEVERLDIPNERGSRQAAAVHICRE
ncbi:MAG: hypothetical protein R3B90_07860 [Planctomycetaceae bacterium]